MFQAQASSVHGKTSVALVESARHSNGSTPPTSNESSNSTHSDSVLTSKPVTRTATTFTTSSNLGPGPRRFRGDVPAFNPSSSSTQIYSQHIHQFAPHPPSSSPVYPNQYPQYYPQQPQLIPYTGVPYYPIAIGYPDYTVYQQYQYYALPGEPFQTPYMTMNNMTNGAAGYISNKKKHFKTHNNSSNDYHYGNQNNTHSNYTHHNSNHNQNFIGASSINQTGDVGVQQSNNKDQSSPIHCFNYTVNLSEHVTQFEARSPTCVPILNAAKDEKATTSSDIKMIIPNESLIIEPKSTQKNQEISNSYLKVQIDNIAQKIKSSPHVSNPALQIELSDDNLPILFGIDMKDFEKQKALISKLSQKLLELKLTRIKELIDADLNKAYYIDEMRTSLFVDHNRQSDSRKKLGTDIPKSFVKLNACTTIDVCAPKSPLNWASFLQSTVKKSKKAVTEISSKGTTSSKLLSCTSSVPPTSKDRYQSFGLSIMSILYDPDFDLYSQESYQFKPRGLTNTGNVCYMNAVLQCLIFCSPFNKILRLLEIKSIGLLGKNSITPVLDATICFMNDFSTVSSSGKSNSATSNSDGIIVGRPLSPEKLFSSLIESPKFQHLKWGQQEDAEEFLVYLLDGLHEDFVKAEATVTIEQINQLALSYGQKLDKTRAYELGTKMKIAARLVNKNGKPSEDEEESEEKDDNGWSEMGYGRKVCSKRVSKVEPSPITSIFGGRFRSVLSIPKSKESHSITIDPYRSISLDITSDDVETIEDALYKLNEAEKLSFKNEGGLDVMASKQTYIEDLPEILTLQLKRFSFEHRGDQIGDDVDIKTSHLRGIGKIEKILKNISFGHDLTVPLESLSPAVRHVSHRNYSLIGVIYHHGRHAEGGHYTCDVLRGDGKWLRVDDTAVELVDAGSVIETPKAKDKSAYIFMYQRKSV